ncbi:hypothetical protein AAE478_002229 [Parahypoxylon ruwenzoriense]
MGGHAFSSGDDALHTPRMPSAVYEHVLRDCHAKLRELFVVVATPIPGPAKKDHGDIDVFLAWEKQVVSPSRRVSSLVASLAPATHDSLEAAARLLNARRTIRSNASVLIVAVPWPDDLPEDAINGNTEDHSGTAVPRFIQVDLHLYSSAEHVQWMLFKHAHGDLWNIVGSTVRPFGLTISDDGLFIRIPEIETRDKKKARILLTVEPNEILEFLGLDYSSTQWEQPFASIKELFEYVATCRLFWVRPTQEAADRTSDPAELHDNSDRPKLSSKERRRLGNRPIYQLWYEEFVPACREAGRFSTQRCGDRDSVRAEVFARFAGARELYRARLIAWRHEQQRINLVREVIKPSIPAAGEGQELSNPTLLGFVAGAFKKMVMQDDYSLGIRPPAPLRDADGLYDEEKVRAFIVDNWKEVYHLVRKENQPRCAERKKKK